MLKKFVVGLVAAGALSVPIAAVAGADPSPSNPGVPGAIGGTPPGSVISDYAQNPVSGPPGKLLGPIHGISSLGHNH